MRIALVDDDPTVRQQMETWMRELTGNAAHIRTYSSGESFLSDWSAGAFDLIVLDIFMIGLTGMDVAHRIRETDPNVRLVFGTSSNEFAAESYEVDACYYLKKPFQEESVRRMFSRLNLEELELMRTAELPDGQSVRLRSVLYADVASHRVTIHCKDCPDLLLRLSFSAVETFFSTYPYFYSPCKGVIINFYEVTAQTGDTFTMSDGTIIPISRRKSREVLEAYSAIRFEQLRKGGI